MSEDEKKAIEVLKEDYKLAKREESVDIDVITNNLGIALKLIEKQEKVIDEMAKYIDENNYVDAEECDFQEKNNIKCVESKDCKDCIKKYFYRKVENDG